MLGYEMRAPPARICYSTSSIVICRAWVLCCCRRLLTTLITLRDRQLTGDGTWSCTEYMRSVRSAHRLICSADWRARTCQWPAADIRGRICMDEATSETSAKILPGFSKTRACSSAGFEQRANQVWIYLSVSMQGHTAVVC